MNLSEQVKQLVPEPVSQNRPQSELVAEQVRTGPSTVENKFFLKIEQKGLSWFYNFSSRRALNFRGSLSKIGSLYPFTHRNISKLLSRFPFGQMTKSEYHVKNIRE